jgi:hypothetical protein
VCENSKPPAEPELGAVDRFLERIPYWVWLAVTLLLSYLLAVGMARISY